MSPLSLFPKPRLIHDNCPLLRGVVLDNHYDTIVFSWTYERSLKAWLVVNVRSNVGPRRLEQVESSKLAALEMAGGIAHEINNLAIIGGNADLPPRR